VQSLGSDTEIHWKYGKPNIKMG